MTNKEKLIQYIMEMTEQQAVDFLLFLAEEKEREETKK